MFIKLVCDPPINMKKKKKKKQKRQKKKTVFMGITDCLKYSAALGGFLLVSTGQWGR